MRRVWTLALVLVLGLVIATPAAQAGPRAPKGAIKLGAGDIKRVYGQTCGRIGNRWHPGTITKSGHFLTLTRQSRTLRAAAKRTRGAARKRKLSAAGRLAAKAQQRMPICRMRPGTYGLPPAPRPIPGGGLLPSTATPPVSAAGPLRFEMRSAVGLALRDSSSTGGSAGLSAVEDSGTLRDAATSGAAPVSRFLIAPNNKVYVLFAQRTNLDDTSVYSPAGCLLAEVDPATGRPLCIDDSLDWITWEDTSSRNPAIQFDAAGGIYYLGSAGGRTVLRRSSQGIRTDLITDNAWLSDFLVLEDGSVVLTGSTMSTSAPWLRRISPAGSLRTLRASQASFLRRFSDGNVYTGMGSGPEVGVLRYLPATDQVDDQLWIGSSYSNPAPHFVANPFCVDWYANQGFCSANGAWIQRSFHTTDGKVFVIAGSGSTGKLMQYFPVLAQPTTAVQKVAVAQGIVTNVVLSGLDVSDRNVTTIYDTSSATETELIGAGDEHEVYHLNYVAEGNRVMFDGLRFSDNRHVIGQIDLDTNTMTSSPLPAGRLAAFQTFR